MINILNIFLILILKTCFVLDVYKFDPDFEANEERYKSLRAEILGSDNEDESGSEDDNDDSDDEDDDEEDGGEEKGKILFNLRS